MASATESPGDASLGKSQAVDASEGSSAPSAPEDVEGKQAKPFRLAPSNVVSDVLFAWVFWLLWRCLGEEPQNVPVHLRSRDRSANATAKLRKAYVDDQRLLKALWQAFGIRFLALGIWKIVWSICTWAGAYYLLEQLMLKQRLSIAVSLLITSVVSAVAIQRLYGGTYSVGLRVKATLIDLVFRKSLVLSPANVHVGHIVTIMATNIEAVADAASHFHFLWSGCLEVLLILVLTVYLAGLRAAVAPVVIIVAFVMPVQLFLGNFVSQTSLSFVVAASDRLRLMTEILTAIKLVKFYAWEKPVLKRVETVRTREARAASFQVFARAINFAFVFGAPVLTTLSCLLVLQLTGAKLDPVLAFTLVSVFNTLRYPLLLLPMAVKAFSSARNAFSIIDEFLGRPEMIDQRDKACPAGSIELQSTSTRWEGSRSDTLSDISVRVGRGEVLAIVGDVGCGKSSLIAAMLGQMPITSGLVSINGKVSYCPQEAWLVNATIKENILFGSDWDSKRYSDVIRVCALERDLSLFVDGDQLEICERGANLSGGQRQRVSMARAVYNQSDIVFLDDPLSALDQNVGRSIFDNCVKGFLADRAVVLVTHQLQYLSQCTNVVVMVDGKIGEYGKFDDLMLRPDGRLRSLMEQFSTTSEMELPEAVDEALMKMIRVPSGTNLALHEPMTELSQSREQEDRELVRSAEVELTEIVSHPSSPSMVIIPNERAIERIAYYNRQLQASVQTVDEATLMKKVEFDQASLFGTRYLPVPQNGHDNRDFSRTVSHNMMRPLTTVTKPFVKDSMDMNSKAAAEWVSPGRTWCRYMRQTGGVTCAVLLFIVFWLTHGVRIGIDIWVKVWQGPPHSAYKAASLGPTNDVAIFSGLCALFICAVAARGTWLARVTAAKARALHDGVLNSLIRAPMSFYDNTPLGRILQSTSKHQADADDRLPDSLMQWMQYLPLAVGSLIVMTVQSSAPLPMFGFVILLLFIGALLVLFTRRSGALVYFLDRQAVAKTMLYSHVTASLEGLFSIRAFCAQDRFKAILLDRLDSANCFDLAAQSVRFFIALYVDVICSLAIFINAYLFVVYSVDAATIGLSLSNALQILVFTGWSLRMWEEASSSIQSVGNLQFLATKLPAEAPDIIPSARPSPPWPQEGSIVFQDVVLRYSLFGVAVLKRINFTIKPMEKIGIVGRTGSGKSTLLVALLRIVELAAGRIIIDGVDISKIGLEDLRSRIAIIPQESVLFSGTIRENLDVKNVYNDADIWKALNAVNLGAIIRDLPDGLNSNVVEKGPRFSLGQRQLFCIARAILMKARVVVLDEATAAIDARTDALVQKAIAENFADCTVLTIAHRLNTIIQSDRILMLSAGKILEFDKPATLLDNPNGAFFSLVAQTGPQTARKLRQLALEKRQIDETRVRTRSDVDFFRSLARPAEPIPDSM
ncbi:unnamed protein product (mitochondrion) [Plasmodiophora brassicae]|uniref:Uncharacterized protein n=1 Tax=Plasmodiophora brassicae TaxID=37360 RepID=A0A0G4J836_PLABS|nr:hypothetical protein PBRA_003380 [Plasmodiophora brassicae]SPQ99730.1 unnamed protein product [Plasmodiophora brassicae]